MCFSNEIATKGDPEDMDLAKYMYTSRVGRASGGEIVGRGLLLSAIVSINMSTFFSTTGDLIALKLGWKEVNRICEWHTLFAQADYVNQAFQSRLNNSAE